MATFLALNRDTTVGITATPTCTSAIMTFCDKKQKQKQKITTFWIYFLILT